MNLANIVATHAYIDDHSGIAPHVCSQYTGQSSAGVKNSIHVCCHGYWNYMCVAMDTETYRGACGNFMSVLSS